MAERASAALQRLPDEPNPTDAARIGERLLAAGADINASGRNGSALHRCARGLGHPDVADWLIVHGADVTLRTPVDALQPLHAAAVAGNVGVAERLLAHGAPVDPLTRDNMTPLNLAQMLGCDDIAALLRRYGAGSIGRHRYQPRPFRLDPVAVQHMHQLRDRFGFAWKQDAATLELDALRDPRVPATLAAFLVAYWPTGALRIPCGSTTNGRRIYGDALAGLSSICFELTAYRGLLRDGFVPIARTGPGSVIYAIDGVSGGAVGAFDFTDALLLSEPRIRFAPRCASLGDALATWARAETLDKPE